jgi:hypothetical protein
LHREEAIFTDFKEIQSLARPSPRLPSSPTSAPFQDRKRDPGILCKILSYFWGVYNTPWFWRV